MKTSSIFLSALLVVFCLSSCVKQSLYPLPEDLVPSNSLAPLPVEIHHSNCFVEGETLLVYSPESLFMDTYNADIYVVEWWANGQLIGSGAQLDCVCGVTVRVLVRHLGTGQVGQLDYTAPNCINQAD